MTKDQVISALGRLPFVTSVARRVGSHGGTVFMFHRILRKGDRCYETEMATAADLFSEFVDWISEDYRVLPLEAMFDRRGKASDRKPVCAITFDDGWIDNFVNAFPVLKQKGVPATIFLPVRFIATRRRFWQEQLWNHLQDIGENHEAVEMVREVMLHFPWAPPQQNGSWSYKDLKRMLMTRPSEEAEGFVQLLAESARLDSQCSDRAFLDWNQIREMQASGISFGSHTMNHAVLTNMPPQAVLCEIRKSREELRERLGVEITSLSYPWGASNFMARRITQEAGYKFALTTQPGLIRATIDPWMVPRIAMSTSVLTLRAAAQLSRQKVRLSLAKRVALSAAPNNARRADNKTRGRIAFVIDRIDGWEGGTETHLRQLIGSLDRNYFEPALFCIFYEAHMPPEKFPCPVHFVCPAGRRKPPLGSRLIRLANMLRGFAPDIVQTFFFEGTMYGVAAARMAGVPFIVGTSRNMHYLNQTPRRLMLRLAEKFADRWICNSRAVWKYQCERAGTPPSRMEIIPNAIDLETFFPASVEGRVESRERLALSPQDFVVVSVANLRPGKNLETLVESAKQVHERRPNAKFLLIGEGPLQDKLQNQIAECGLSKTVQLLGRQPDVRPYLAAADVGVLTSLSEGSSNSLLEYMAAGLPTVVSDVPANRDLVDGVYFPPQDPKALAANLMAIADDVELRSQLSSQNRQRALLYGVNFFTRRAQAFYSELLRDT